MDDAEEQRIRSSARQIIAELAPNQAAEVTDDSTLVDELEYTSLALTELAFTLEDEFDLLPIDEQAARAISTVGHICDHVLREIRARQAA